MNQKSRIKFVFAGDFYIGGDFIRYVRKKNLDFLYPFSLVDKEINEADIILLNLEAPIYTGSTNSNKRDDVKTIISNHPSILKYLRSKKICVANLANNHIMDYGTHGLANTCELLRENGIYYVGAGIDTDDSSYELIINFKNKKIAFLSFTSNEPSVGSIIADKDKSGCNSFLESQKVINKISSMKKEVDIICLILHWGREFFIYPSSDQVKLAHLFADAGATYIVGHHPHVIQGIEKYNNTLILYSLGNFFFPPVRSIYGRPQFQKKITKEFMLVRSEIDESLDMNWHIIGGILGKNFILKPYDKNERNEFIKKVNLLSIKINNKSYEIFWKNYKKQRERELQLENIIEVFKKIFSRDFLLYIKTISFNDLKRNIVRIIKIFH